VGSQAAGAAISTLWQLNLLWGVLGGIGTGMAAQVLGATVANRWFVARRGLVLGFFGAAGSAGQLLFVPLLMALVVAIGWRASHLVLAGAVALVLIPVFFLMRDDPADLGLRPYGAPLPPPGSVAPAPVAALPAGAGVMARAVRVPEFWLLSGSFFVCGATSNGLIGTHLIPHSADHGISEVTAAGALALMGSMNFAGTLASGWLTDRYDPRRLLACYYFFRGLSLFLLPFVADFSGLAIFAVVFGLDYIATVPPTSALTADIFGRRNVGTVFGWVFFAHQVGAALAAYLGGVARVALGDYQLAFLVAGTLAVLAALMALRVDRGARPSLQPASAPA
jgi:sugar phosphate permease